MTLSNGKLATETFLKTMYASAYFPDAAVDKVKDVLVRLCESIERETPADAAALFALTHAATDEINELQEVFWDLGSEIETGAREAIAEEFGVIVSSYGFDVDIEEVIATRDW